MTYAIAAQSNYRQMLSFNGKTTVGEVTSSVLFTRFGLWRFKVTRFPKSVKVFTDQDSSLKIAPGFDLDRYATRNREDMMKSPLYKNMKRDAGKANPGPLHTGFCPTLSTESFAIRYPDIMQAIRDNPGADLAWKQMAGESGVSPFAEIMEKAEMITIDQTALRLAEKAKAMVAHDQDWGIF